jgi:hypothetical protein
MQRLGGGGAVLVAMLVGATSVHAAAVATPRPLAPVDGAVVATLPAFGWSAVRGADHYTFQLAADRSFASPVHQDGDPTDTRNTWAAMVKAEPDGTYFWRVRAVTHDGHVSGWSAPRRVVKRWSTVPRPLAPANGATVTYPQVVTLRYTQPPGASKYAVVIAQDPALSTGVLPVVQTDAPAVTISQALDPGKTYYWAVTPVDSQGNRGVSSPVYSFRWSWPSSTTLTYEDLAPSPDVVDPRFSWTAVPGAKYYTVEVNADDQFATGSKVCCDDLTIGTALSPANVLPNNTYYWRVRAVDADGHQGAWQYPQPGFESFRKTFDTRDPGDPLPSISNLRMADNATDPGTDADFDPTNGYQTSIPIVTWDPVLGASAYEVDVRLYSGGACAATATWHVYTAVTAWTPLGWGKAPSANPWPGSMQPSFEAKALTVNGAYCVRVRALSDDPDGGLNGQTSHQVVGDWTYLDNHNDPSGQTRVSFEWLGDPGGATCPSPTDPTPAYPLPTDYGVPAVGETRTTMPYFTWNAIPDAHAYFVVVARDANFTQVVDYAFTRVPAYAPRTGTATVTYPDETTSYYWAVLPARSCDGGDALPDPLSANAASFLERADPPTLLGPDPAAVVTGQPTFSWTLANAAREYHLQIAKDSHFSDPIDVQTASSSYTPTSALDADTLYYWRVQALDERGVGLTWSTAGTFTKVLARPVPSASNPLRGETVPTWLWSPVPGAVSYDVEVTYPDGRSTIVSGLRAAAITGTKMDGTGTWHWRVRAEFQKSSTQKVAGPWSVWTAFVNQMGAPVGPHTTNGKGSALLCWSPKAGSDHYAVEIADRQDFNGLVERVATDMPCYAPTLKAPVYRFGGKLWWRVAPVDETGNVGKTTGPLPFTLPLTLRVSAAGLLRRGRPGILTVSVSTGTGQDVRRALVTLTGAARGRRRTGSDGRVRFTLRPRRGGAVVVTVALKGYATTTAVVSVR